MPMVKLFIRPLLVMLVLILLLAACQTSQAEPVSVTIAPTLTNTSQAIVSPSPTETLSPTLVSTTVPTLHSVTRVASATVQPSATPEQRVILRAVGDIMLGRTIGELIETEGPQAPFLDTAETLHSADITVATWNARYPSAARLSRRLMPIGRLLLPQNPWLLPVSTWSTLPTITAWITDPWR